MQIPELPDMEGLIVALTKRSVEHRLASIRGISFTITEDYEIYPINSVELQICLETQQTIILAEVEYCGYFEVSRTGVTIKGQGEKSVIKYKGCQGDASLVVSGHGCFLHDFYVSVEGFGFSGINVSGDANTFRNVTVTSGHFGCYIFGAGNSFDDVKVASSRYGAEVLGDQNSFNGFTMENITETGFGISGSKVFIDDFQFSYGNSEAAASPFRHGLLISALSHNCEIRSSNCCVVIIEGKNHTLRDVNCEHILKIANVPGNEHQLERCKGKTCQTDGASIPCIMGNNGNEFSIYSRGRDLREILKSCNSGDVIQLEEGIYVGGFAMTKNNITLKGVGDRTIIACVSYTDTVGLSILANDCTISDLQFSIPFKETTGMRVTGANNVIRNVFFRGGWICIDIDGDGNILRDIRIFCTQLYHEDLRNMFSGVICRGTVFANIWYVNIIG